MPILNAFDAAPGRTVEVVWGDLFAEAIDVDLLVISAWVDHYEPDPGSMVAVLLERCGLKVGDLRRQLDFSKEPMIRGWVSYPLERLKPPPRWPAQSMTRFKRLAVVESLREPKQESTEKTVFRQLFCLLALMPLHDIECTSVATPLLNTGRQKAEPEQLYPAMMRAVGNGFRHVPDLHKLVIFDLKRQPLDLLCSQIDNKLGRNSLQRISLNQDHQEQLKRLLQTVEAFQEKHGEVANDPALRGYFTNIIQQLRGKEVTLVTLAIEGRKVLEALVAKRLRGRGRELNLYSKIKVLSKDAAVSAWSASAMHTVRTFGNWMGHAPQDENTDVMPQRGVEASDMLLMLYALQRVLSDYPWPIGAKSKPYVKRLPPKPIPPMH
jgi:hypothetical protein